MLLKKTRIDNALPEKKLYRLNDGEGLYLVVTSAGGKLWQFRYHFAGKARTMSYGSYSEVSMEEARLKRQRDRDLLRNNIDPGEWEKKERYLTEFRANNTLEKVAREWHDHRRNAKQWSEKRASLTIRRLENHVFPYLGSRPIEGIEPLEILTVAQRIENRGHTYLSHEVLWIMKAVFRRAVRTRRLKENPAADLSEELIPHRAENMRTIPEDEISRFLRRLEANEQIHESTRLAIWLLMLTAVRTCELRLSKKSDFLLQRKEWILRPEITKMKREHVVPLSSAAMKIVEQLFDQSPDSEWLLPSRKQAKAGIMSDGTINKALRILGYEGQLTGHGFRSLFSTTLNEHGFDPRVVDRQLAHVSKDKVEAAYNRAEYLPMRCLMMEWWGQHVISKKRELSTEHLAWRGEIKKSQPDWEVDQWGRRSILGQWHVA